MAQNEVVRIDIDKVVAARAKGKKIPKFVIRWIKKFIHQDELNEFLDKGYLGVDFAVKGLEYLNVKIDIIGEENIPAEGKFTFVCNHPLGGVDALNQIAFLGTKYNGNIVSPANDFLMNVKQVQEYLVPVNKLGAQGKSLSGLLDEAFQGDRQLFIFPAGLCSRKIDGVITDTPWKKTFITKSRESQRDIIPMWFSGHNSKRFYRVDAFCKFFGIKFPLAMLCLPDEVFRCRNKSFQVRIGKPIPWETFTKDKKDIEWANEVRKVCYALGEE